MLLRRLRLVNYGGIYNGMGLYEIDIDFTRCKNRLILIKGDNGTGKSTIENALKPLPDENSSFIQGRDACKEIEYFDEFTNIIYKIQFYHEYKSNGTRNTKGYIQKIIVSTGNITELNPSGNITSCKNVIYEELQLDPNYITLTQLSNTKRGIADLRPADRKRYVNAILNNTDVYNDMHKKLSKKSTSYKSLMNSIIAKLDNIGDITQLSLTLKGITDSIDKIEDQINKFIELKARSEGALKTIDPDHTIEQEITIFLTELEKYQSKKHETEKELHQIYVTNKNRKLELEYRQTDVEDLEEKLNNAQNEMSIIKSQITTILETRQVESDELQVKTAKLRSLNSDESIEEVKEIKDRLNNRKYQIEKRWGFIVDIKNMTREEFISCINNLKITKEIIDYLPQEVFRNNEMYYRNRIDSINKLIYDLDRDINNTRKEYEEVLIKESKLSVLSKRPINCEIDSCPFVREALDIKRSDMKSSLYYNDKLKKLEEQKESYITEVNDIQSNILPKYMELKNIRNTYENNRGIFVKVKLGFDTFDNFLAILQNHDSYHQVISMLQSLLDYSNDLEEYKTIDKSIMEITSKFDKLSSQEEFISILVNDINKLQSQLDTDNNKINSMNSRLKELNFMIEDFKERIDIISNIIGCHDMISSCDEAIDVLNEEIDRNRSNIDKIQKIKKDIADMGSAITDLTKRLVPLKTQRDDIKFKLEMSKQYTSELEDYKAKYNQIETLKYYSSPTTGIQLLFANMYLNKILNNANEILSRLFSGQFALLPLIITETEFRIPVAVKGGINHDDITSMSSAQISLISMIISISLLSQTSTKLNIIVGDEIDAPFDSENRREFINILYQLMGLVNSSQCVLISHNSEIPLDNCDVILLRSENDMISNGNIIWNYNNR